MVAKTQRIRGGDQVKLTQKYKNILGYRWENILDKKTPFTVKKTSSQGFWVYVDLREGNRYGQPQRMYSTEVILLDKNIQKIKEKLWRNIQNGIQNNNEQETIPENNDTNAQHQNT